MLHALFYHHFVCGKIFHHDNNGYLLPSMVARFSVNIIIIVLTSADGQLLHHDHNDYFYLTWWPDFPSSSLSSSIHMRKGPGVWGEGKDWPYF